PDTRPTSVILAERPVLPTFCSEDPHTAALYTLSLHDALPISREFHAQDAGIEIGGGSDIVRDVRQVVKHSWRQPLRRRAANRRRSEEHTSELQSQSNLVCRLLLEKKK